MSLARDFLAFLACHKKWWATPICAALVWLAALALTGQETGTTTFRYTMF